MWPLLQLVTVNLFLKKTYANLYFCPESELLEGSNYFSFSADFQMPGRGPGSQRVLSKYFLKGRKKKGRNKGRRETIGKNYISHCKG